MAGLRQYTIMLIFLSLGYIDQKGARNLRHMLDMVCVHSVIDHNPVLEPGTIAIDESLFVTRKVSEE